MSLVSRVTSDIAGEVFNGGSPGQIWIRDQTQPSGGRWVDVATILPASVLAAAAAIAALPTADPHVAGQVWNNAGVLVASAG
jgi:hypothetical protein